jgi:hypothetical protein
MKKITLLLSLTFALLIDRIYSQCVPEAADACDGALVLCSLDELNGFKCTNSTLINPTACLPCNGTGAPNNSSWWAFVAEGGPAEIKIQFSDCYNPFGSSPLGVQVGIVSACDCSGSIACHSDCNGNGDSIIIKANLQSCKVYYLWVDGCNGDVCNFIITTSGGKHPILDTLSNISSIATNPICKGACYDFSVNPQTNDCVPEYIWTLDSLRVGGNTNNAIICFPNEGSFSLCVYAAIGNPSSGSICSQTQPKCIQVVVEKKKDEIAKPKILCAEDKPYRWWCHTITTSGTYRCPFNINSSCEFDSVINISFLEPVEDGPDVYFIGCGAEKYVDPITKTQYSECNNRTEVKVPKSTNPYACDSTYFLSTIYPSAFGNITIFCRSGEVILNASVQATTALCGLSPDVVESIEWYDKLKPGTVLGTGREIQIFRNSFYAVRYILTYTFGDKTKTCKFDFCETINEDKYFFKPTITGPVSTQNGSIEKYETNLPMATVDRFIWRVEGGIILDSFPEKKSMISVKWNELPDTLGKICLSIESECGYSDEVCLDVKLQNPNSIEYNDAEDFTIIPNPNDGNFVITNEQLFKVIDIRLMNLEGKIVKISTSRLSNKQISVQLKNIESGIYTLQVHTTKGILNKSIVVQTK